MRPKTVDAIFLRALRSSSDRWLCCPSPLGFASKGGRGQDAAPSILFAEVPAFVPNVGGSFLYTFFCENGATAASRFVVLMALLRSRPTSWRWLWARLPSENFMIISEFPSTDGHRLATPMWPSGTHVRGCRAHGARRGCTATVTWGWGCAAHLAFNRGGRGQSRRWSIARFCIR